MKKVSLTIYLFLLNFIPSISFSININEISNIYDSMEFVMNSINFENITITSDIPYNLVLQTIQKHCPETVISQAISELWSLNQFSNYYPNKPNAKDSLPDKFNTVKWLIINQKKDNEYDYCKNSYLLFSTLKAVHELYTENSDAESSENKETTAQENKKSHNSATDKKSDFTFIHNTDWLPDNAKTTFSKSTEMYLQKIMANLVNDNILNKNDLNILNNKIQVAYQQTCDFTEWTFRAVKDLESGEYTFKDINLIIAYCEKNNTSERQNLHIQQILAHELGHYIYYFKDQNPSEFIKICRNNGEMSCTQEWFVSDYSQELPEEDYAESFAFWYLYGPNWKFGNQYGIIAYEPLFKKFEYFKILFG